LVAIITSWIAAAAKITRRSSPRAMVVPGRISRWSRALPVGPKTELSRIGDKKSA
jgi:hypothetical protein